MTSRKFPGLEAPALAADLLDGRVVIVTGASMGIGRACAEQALRCGARVVIAARGAEALDEAAATLASAHGEERVTAVVADVGRASDVERIADAALERGGPLHALIHAAAVIGPIGPSLELDAEAWFDTLRINLLGSYLMARAAARRLRAARTAGRIVLLSGGGATSPFPNYTAYACSKAGIVRLAETLALELAPDGIAVNALAPGFVATRMHDRTLAAGAQAGADYLRSTMAQLDEGGVPVELSAAAAVYLISDLARAINGKLVSAPWDRWWEWPEHASELADTDVFTLRRIVPRDRGGHWQ